MLKLYGNTRSRAMRCLWMLEQLEQPYELVEKTVRDDDLQQAEYLHSTPADRCAARTGYSARCNSNGVRPRRPPVNASVGLCRIATQWAWSQ
jgi:hypothetical protein